MEWSNHFVAFMPYYMFAGFWAVFGVGYITRDKSMDAEKDNTAY